MLHILDAWRGLTFASVCMRLVVAGICGGLIGIEREYKRRPAGFRTHILICLGAAITTVTGQYLLLYMRYFTDVSRLGAQVVSGISFIGAGCILVTKHHRVKGLTTAAGLWSAAIIGLTTGAGFYEAAAFGTLIVLFAELVLSKLEYLLWESAPEVTLYIECLQKNCLDSVFRQLRVQKVKLISLEAAEETEQRNACAIVTVQTEERRYAEQMIAELLTLRGVVSVDRL